MSMAPEVLKLIGCQKAEFNHASKLRSALLRTQTAIAVIAAATVPITHEIALYVAAIVALVLAGFALYLAQELSASRGHAERLRRTTMLIGGLGFQLPGAELLELCRDGSAPTDEAKRLVDPDYFASKQPVGPARMVEMLEESAIWTANLAKYAARESWLLFGGIFISMVIALFGAAAFAEPSQWQLGARIVLAILAALLSVDFMGAAVNYDLARQAALRVVDKLQPHKSGSASLEHVMLIFSDYNSAVESMPPFPSGLWARHQKRLNEEYNMFLTGPQP